MYIIIPMRYSVCVFNMEQLLHMIYINSLVLFACIWQVELGVLVHLCHSAGSIHLFIKKYGDDLIYLKSLAGQQWNIVDMQKADFVNLSDQCIMGHKVQYVHSLYGHCVSEIDHTSGTVRKQVVMVLQVICVQCVV